MSDSLVDMPLDYYPDFVTFLLGKHIADLDLTFLSFAAFIIGRLFGSSLRLIGMSWVDVIGGCFV
jgi:hypothetical protein